MSQQRRNIAGYTPQARLSLLTKTGGDASEPGLSTILDTLLSRATEIQAIATLAGLRVKEVSAGIQRLEGPVWWTQSSVSAILKFPHKHALLLRQTVLRL